MKLKPTEELKVFKMNPIDEINKAIDDYELRQMHVSQVKICNKSENELPEYETENSAGMDLRANASITIGAMKRALVPTGLFIELPEGMEAQIRPRSGLALRNGITVLNSPGTIDADYRGEIGIILINLSDEPFKITTGDRIAQIVFTKHETVTLKPSIELTETKRGKGGFGSTGKK